MSQKTKTPFKSFEAKTVIEIGSLLFLKKFVILDIEEGAHLGIKQVKEIQIIVSQYYKEQPYGYLLNKDISYSVNPIAYNSLNSIDELKSIAIVKKYSSSHDIEVEKHFIKKPFEVFATFEEASDWLISIV